MVRDLGMPKKSKEASGVSSEYVYPSHFFEDQHSYIHCREVLSALQMMWDLTDTLSKDDMGTELTPLVSLLY